MRSSTTAAYQASRQLGKVVVEITENPSDVVRFAFVLRDVVRRRAADSKTGEPVMLSRRGFTSKASSGVVQCVRSNIRYPPIEDGAEPADRFGIFNLFSTLRADPCKPSPVITISAAGCRFIPVSAGYSLFAKLPTPVNPGEFRAWL